MKFLYQASAALLLFLPLGMASYAADSSQPSQLPPPPAATTTGSAGMGGMGGMGGGGMGGMGGGMHQGMGMHKGMGMMGQMTDAQREQHLQAMQDHMLEMHDLSNKILAETDPAKKEQLKKQQLDLMKAHMQMRAGHGNPPQQQQAPQQKPQQ